MKKRYKIHTRINLNDEVSTCVIAEIFEKTTKTINRWFKSGKLQSKSVGDVIQLLKERLNAF